MVVIRAALAALLAFAAACGTSGGGDDPACGQPPSVVGQLAALDSELEIGVRQGGRFEPATDGGTLELVLGAQGGWMVVPMLRVQTAELTDDVVCAWVNLSADVGDGGIVTEQLERSQFQLSGAFFESDDLFAFLSLDLTEVEGQPIRLRVDVDVEDRSASAQLEATLVNDN